MSADNPGDGYYSKWYAANRAKLSKKRKERYRSDPTVREQAIEYQRNYRSTKARSTTKGQPHFREVAGKTTQVYRIAAAAEMAGCSIEFIRKYETQGVIPKSAATSPQRYYSAQQVALIKAFYLLMVELKYSKDKTLKDAAIAKSKAEMHANWLGE